MEYLYKALLEQVSVVQIDSSGALLLFRFLLLGITAFLMWLSYVFFKKILKPVVSHFVQRTQVTWDDMLLNDKVLSTTAHLLPPLIAYLLIPLIFYPIEGVRFFYDEQRLAAFFMSLIQIYIVLVAVRWCFVLLTNIRFVLESHLDHRSGYIVGVIQVLKILVAFVGFIWMVSILIGKSPVALFAGLGAAATVLMLVFKDSILGLVAGIQLSANDMLRKGDWITVPQSGADGTVEEISLTAVKVRNFDNTITTLPPYSLVSQSFQNWRGMQTSAGRRVRRVLPIDAYSVHHLDEQVIRHLRECGMLSDREVASPVNLILFRDAMEDFLARQEVVNHEMKMMVRQMPLEGRGIPMEFYFFLKEKEWVTYEHQMHDLLSQIMVMLQDFELTLYQQPSGKDLSAWTEALH